MTTFHTSRDLLASPQAVFAAFQQPHRLARWWGPAGFRNSFETCEFERGGRWRFTMHGPDGVQYANESVFAEIEAGRLVVIDHVSAPRFRLAVALQPHRHGTRVSWTQTFEDAAVATAIRHIVEPANEQNLDRLAAEAEGPPSASGTCLCGAVRFAVPMPALWVAHCHCTRCQRAHGAAFVTWVGTTESEAVIDDPDAALRWHAAQGRGQRGFCSHCGSPMFFKADRWPGELHVARALFSSEVRPAPQMHAFHDTQVPWVTLGDDLPCKTEAETR